MVQQSVEIGTRSQLFVDDYLVAASEGMATRLHPMTKHSEAVLQAEEPWERPETGGLWSPNALFDPSDGLFKMWYGTMGTFPARNRQSEPHYACYATSADGLNWERPNLGLFKHDGSSNNNIIVAGGSPGPGGGILDSLEMTGLEPPERRFKSVGSHGRDAEGRYGHGVTFSPDGVHWQRYEGNPVISGYGRGDTISCAKLRDPAFPEDIPGLTNAKYALFPKVHPRLGRFNRRSFAMCTSEDDLGGNPFTQWTEPQLVLAADLLDDEMGEERLAAAKSLLLWDHPDDHRCEFYGVKVWRSGDLFLALVMIYDACFEIRRLGFNNEYAIVDVQLASSRDLLHWQRLGDRQPVITRGDPESFDSHLIFFNSLPVSVGDEWWVYYAGFNEGHAARSVYDEAMRQQYHADVKAGRRHFQKVGLAKVRRDGFISRNAGSAGGTLTTRLIQPGGSRLELNATAAEGGAITVEVQDEHGRVLPDFAAADCTPVAGDSLRHEGLWGEHRGDDRWQDRPVHLKFHVRDAKLYGFQFAA
ncbi:MAG: hypothetical protein CL878_01180 [Dehalococcoidia bacterium]|nr:hypothetical protein [Dehalococcoidia bacterium]